MNDLFIESTQPAPRRANLRYSIPAIILAIIVSTLLFRSFYLQVVQGSDFRERAEHNRIHQIAIEAPRGILYDRYNQPFVSNIPSTELLLDPVLLPPREEEAFLIENLLELLPDLTPEQLQTALQEARTRGRAISIAQSLDHDTVLLLEEAADRIRGTRLASVPVRQYTPGHAAAHVIGYTGSVTDSDLSSNEQLRLTDQIGKTGLEKQYDDVLRGKPGAAYQEVNASGRPQVDLGTTPPEPGQDIKVSLDKELQDFIYGFFSEREQKKSDEGSEKQTRGAVVVMDPQNGEIIAAVCYPSFDPNAFSQRTQQNLISSYTSDPAQPLFNRITDGTYPSGSVIKPFIAAGALQEGIITPDTTLLSQGGISVGPWNFPDWKAGGHGVTDVKKAIAESVNTFFYAITGGWESQEGLGVTKATAYLREFGWGAPTGVDLPSEAAGFLPSPEWKEEVKKESWYIGDTYHLGIGQGDVLVTPLQIASSTSAIANGNFFYEPHFVPGEADRYEIPISLSHIQTIQAAMRQTVTEGSARSLSNLPSALAGKTGTAQIGGTEDTHAWFTSFGPYEHPEFVVTVLLERGGAGDEDAVPFAKEIWQWIIENRLQDRNIAE